MAVKIKLECWRGYDGHLHQDTANEEHYTILSESGNQYVAHLTPSSGKARDITRELADLLQGA